MGKLTYYNWYKVHRCDVIPEDELGNLRWFELSGVDVVGVVRYEDVSGVLRVIFRSWYEHLYERGIIAPDVFIKAKNGKSRYTSEDIIRGCDEIDGYIIYVIFKLGYGNKYAVPDTQYHLANTILSRMLGQNSGFVQVGGFDVSFYRGVLERYCPIGGVVYDPSCGWGNRLVACTEYDIVRYLGTDPSIEMKPYYDSYVSEHEYRFEPDIRCQGSEVFISEWKNQVDLVCTCPPYYNVEQYPGVDGWGSIDDFRDFVYKTVVNCYSYLRDGGVCMFYVGDNNELSLSSLYMDIMSGVGFKDVDWYIKDKGNVGTSSVRKNRSGWVFGRK